MLHERIHKLTDGKVQLLAYLPKWFCSTVRLSNTKHIESRYFCPYYVHGYGQSSKNGGWVQQAALLNSKAHTVALRPIQAPLGDLCIRNREGREKRGGARSWSLEM